jgi:flagella basal body P-ring formation protein FlgA
MYRLLVILSFLPTAVWAEEYHSHEQIRQAAHDFLTQLHREVAGQVRVEIGAPDSRLRLARCGTALEAFTAPGGRSIGNTTVGVRCPGPQTWSLYLSAAVRVQTPVLVAARAIPGGALIAAGDLKLAERDLSTLPAGYFSSPAQAVGKRLRYPIAAGAALNPAMLSSPKLVRRGDQVTLVAGTPDFEVRANGMALTDGGAGEIVRVRNSLSKKEIEGTVTSAGLVQVRL